MDGTLQAEQTKPRMACWPRRLNLSFFSSRQAEEVMLGGEKAENECCRKQFQLMVGIVVCFINAAVQTQD